MTTTPHDAGRGSTFYGVIARAAEGRAEVRSEGSWIIARSVDGGPRPEQGWKLHISAYPSSAGAVLGRTLPVLLREGAHFKVAASEAALAHLNIGAGGPSQIGKFITVYPSTDGDAVRIAASLDAATSGLEGPAVPSDRRLRRGSLVHYRYGGFGRSLLQLRDGTVTSALVTPAGEVVADERLPYFSPPAWAADPFGGSDAAGSPADLDTDATRTQYYVSAVLSQSARGSVMLGLDLAHLRPCVMKAAPKGRAREGSDSTDRLRREAAVLARIGPRRGFPALYDILELEDRFVVVMEDIPGETLADHVATALSGRLADDAEVVSMALPLAALVEHLHDCGLVYRDLKSSNVLVVGGAPVLIDFELAVEPGHRSRPVGTAGYMSPQQSVGEPASFADDVYGFGALLFLLATGAEPCLAPDVSNLLTRPLLQLNPSLSPILADVVAAALDPDPQRRPTLATIIRRLAELERRPRHHEPDGEGTGVPEAEDERRGRCAEFARRLGDTLCDDAEVTPHGCTWSGDGHDFLPIPYRRINNGVAGVVLTLAELWRTFRVARHRETLLAGCRWLAHSQAFPGATVAGLYIGEAGVGAALLRAGQVTGDEELIAAARACEARMRVYPYESPDLFNGTAGRLRFLVLLWHQTRDPDALDHARTCAEHLLATASRPRPGQACWSIPDGYNELSGMTQSSYAHGAAGIADALLDLYELTGEPRLAETAVQAGRWVEDQAIATLHDESGIDWGPRGAFRGLWCYGASGVGRLFLRLARLGLLDGALATAERAGRTVAQTGRSAGPEQCHGLAGSIEYLLDLYRATGRRTWLDAAWELEALLQAFRVDVDGRVSWIADSADGRGNHGYMVGYAGVALCLLRLSEPERSSVQLSVETFCHGGVLV